MKYLLTKSNIKVIALLLIITVVSGSLPLNLLPAFANPNIVRIPSEYYTASFMYHSQWHDNTEFSHGILIDNHSSHVIRHWRVLFELDNGIVETVSHEAIIESSSGTVVIDQAGGGQQVWPGPSLYLTIGGVAFGQTINPQNIRLYGLIDSGDAGGGNQNQGGGSTYDPVIPPVEYPELFIVTNNLGTVFTHGRRFAPGEAFTLTAIPDRGYFLESYRSTSGQLIRHNYVNFSFVMPSYSVTLYFDFIAGEPLQLTLPNAVDLADGHTLTMRRLDPANVVTSTIYENYQFASGELVVIATRYASYREIVDLAYEHGGEIVGFLQVSNTYQIYFTGTSEAELRAIAQAFNDSDLVTLAILNVVTLHQIPPAPFSQFRSLAPARMAVGLVFPSIEDYLEYLDTMEERRVERMGLPSEPNDPLFRSGYQWALGAINVFGAWERNNQIEERVNVGVLDSLFSSHPDLNFEELRTFSANPLAGVHGNHVTGILAAGTNNGIGIAGILNSQPDSVVAPDSESDLFRGNANIFAYPIIEGQVQLQDVVAGTDHFSPIFSVMYGLSWMFSNNVRIVNVALAVPPPTQGNVTFNIYDQGNEVLRAYRDILASFLQTYLDLGHEFLIVQGAGNSSRNPQWVNAGYSGFFANITYDFNYDIANRIIVVGNMDEGNNIFFTSSIGDLVDIVAPGANILSTTVPGIGAESSDYDRLYGTSMAAPHVAGVAGMVWGINPYLTGAEVRQAILDNTRQTPEGQTHYAGALFPDGSVASLHPILDADRATWAVDRYNPNRIQGSFTNGNRLNSVFGVVRYNETDVTALNITRTFTSQTTGQQLTSDQIREIAIDENLAQTPSDPNEGSLLTIPTALFAYTLPRDIYVMHTYVDDVLRHIALIDLTTVENFQVIDLSYPSIIIRYYGEDIVTYPFDFLAPSAFLKNYRVMVPMVPMLDFLGLEGIYSPLLNTVHIYAEERTLMIPMDGPSLQETFVIIDSSGTVVHEAILYDAIGAMVINGTHFLPIRSLVSPFGYDPELNQEGTIVNITASGTPVVFRPTGRIMRNENFTPIISTYDIGDILWR